LNGAQFENTVVCLGKALETNEGGNVIVGHHFDVLEEQDCKAFPGDTLLESIKA
jgi:hypothetical protein